jgi:hypothetical protein
MIRIQKGYQIYQLLEDEEDKELPNPSLDTNSCENLNKDSKETVTQKDSIKEVK